MLRKASSNKLRIGRVSEEGRIYHITLTTYQRHPYFDNFWTGRCLVNALQQVHQSAETLCYVVMPDHLHWLMQVHNQQNLSSIVQKVKSLATKSLRSNNFLADDDLWQKGFHDRALRREDDIQQVARYIVANPIRAGIVKSVREYSLWDAIWV